MQVYKKQNEFIIYAIINKINNKKYVGQTNNLKRRWTEHKSLAKTGKYKYKSILYEAIRKYGVEKFYIEEIEKCYRDDLEWKEKYWINKLDTLVPDGYNLLKGGRILSDESNPFYGRKHSIQTKQQISNKNKGRIQSAEEIEIRKQINNTDKNPFFNKHHSKETKEKISNKLKNNASFIENTTKRMLSNNPNKNGRYSKKRKVALIDKITLETIMTFISVKEAGRYILDLKIIDAKNPDNTIRDVCKNRMKTAYGYMWKYVNERKERELYED